MQFRFYQSGDGQSCLLSFWTLTFILCFMNNIFSQKRKYKTDLNTQRNLNTRWNSYNFPYHITPTRNNPTGPDGSLVVPAALAVGWLWGTRGAGGCDEHKSKWHHSPSVAPASTRVTHAATFSFSQSSAKSGWCISVCPRSLHWA